MPKTCKIIELTSDYFMSACNLIVLIYAPQHNSFASTPKKLNVHIIMLSFEK